MYLAPGQGIEAPPGEPDPYDSAMPTTGSLLLLRKRRPARTAMYVLVAALLITGCNRLVAGSPLPAEQGSTQKFDKVIDEIDRYLEETTNVTATHTWQATVNERSDESRMTYAYRGEPATTLVNRDPDHPDRNVTVYHPGGSDSDYYLLGPRYRSLAPTDWVKVPTTRDPDIASTCMLPSKMNLCKMVSAIEKTVAEGDERVATVAYTRDDGGTTLLSNTTVETFIDQRVIIFPDEVVQGLTKEIKKSLLSARIDLDSENNITQVQIKGKATQGSKKFVVDVLHEITGKATESDFPAVPSGDQVTTIEDKDKAEKFRDAATGDPPA